MRYCLRERAWAGWIPPGPAWVPKLFQNAGYATFWTGYDGNAGTFSRQIRGFQHGFSSWRLSPKSGRDRQYELAADVEIAQMAIEEIDRAVARQTRFFGWVFFVSPHDDYVAHYDGRPADTMEHRYEQEIRFSDENLGRLIDHIRERRLLQETIVIVASDHGEEFYEHGGQQHRSSLYNEQTRVPLVVRIPHVEGEFVETPTSLIYLFPWLLQHGTAAMREMARQRLEGDIGPMLRATDGAVVLEIVGLDKHYAGLIHGNKKLIFNFHSQLFELYDLGRDPGERQNLALSRPAEMQSFRARFESYLRVQRGNQRAVLCRDVAWH